MTSLPQVGAGERFGDIIRSCPEIGPVIYLWNLWTCSHIRDSLTFACRALSCLNTSPLAIEWDVVINCPIQRYGSCRLEHNGSVDLAGDAFA